MLHDKNRLQPAPGFSFTSYSSLIYYTTMQNLHTYTQPWNLLNTLQCGCWKWCKNREWVTVLPTFTVSNAQMPEVWKGSVLQGMSQKSWSTHMRNFLKDLLMILVQSKSFKVPSMSMCKSFSTDSPMPDMAPWRPQWKPHLKLLSWLLGLPKWCQNDILLVESWLSGIKRIQAAEGRLRL